MKKTFISLLVTFVFWAGCSSTKTNMYVSGEQNNDLFKIMQTQKNLKIVNCNSPHEAVDKAQNGEAVLVLATGYPTARTSISLDFFDLVRSKNLKVYVEFPSQLPGFVLGETKSSSLERAVINSDFFGSTLDTLQILGINGLNYLPVKVQQSHIVSARVAGFDNALYGLPENVSPLLFELPGYSMLVSTTCLSRFVTGRYAPQKEWGQVWTSILNYLVPQAHIKELTWQPVVSPAFGKNEKLPDDVQIKSVQKGVEWYSNAKLLIHESRADTMDQPNQKGLLKWKKEMPIGDGSFGSYEAIMSVIDENGRQPIGTVKRGDCITETAMAFATSGKLLQNSTYLDISKNLLDFYLVYSPAVQNEYADPNHGAYGLIPWGINNYAWYRASYGDDNARQMLATMVSAAVNNTTQWDETIMKCLLATFRTTGTNGFRGNRIDLPDFEKNGWEYYFNRDIINIRPHYEAYLWACFLWAYDKTGYEPFLQKAEKAIKITMENYPDGWRWTNGIAQEKARILLPLAWLVRVKNSEENRAKLINAANELLKLQDECGAIREELGDLKMGSYPPPQSNEDYGTNEASLIAKNGDPVSDLLYTTNFSFLGLHEAAYASGDPKIKAAADKLAEFLCRIQVKSQDHPELDGGWFRAFDYQRFEHWGANADHGWGAWCIESGWTQGWIVSILALREQNTSIWDLTNGSKVGEHFEALREEMLPME